MCCQSPEPAPEDSESKTTGKRTLGNGDFEASPARRSKRQKSTVNLKEESDSEAEASENETLDSPVKEEKDTKPLTAKTAKRKAPVKKESKGDAKSKKTKKSKDQEAETMPLAPRTQGLRMFVGAHVSAAKGWFRLLSTSRLSLTHL